jgi:hypothetical protein
MPFGTLDTKGHSRFDLYGVKYTICTNYKYTEAFVAASTANYGSFLTMTWVKMASLMVHNFL